MNKIEELRSELNNFKKELEKKIDKLEKEEQEWKPQHDEQYWFYDRDLEDIKKTTWLDYSTDNLRLRNKVIFKTEQEAQRYADYQKAKREESYDFTKEEWEDNNVVKYYIYYSYESEALKNDYSWTCRDINKTYFKTEEQAQEFIDKYKDEILEFEFGIKE